MLFFYYPVWIKRFVSCVDKQKIGMGGYGSVCVRDIVSLLCNRTDIFFNAAVERSSQINVNLSGDL